MLVAPTIERIVGGHCLDEKGKCLLHTRIIAQAKVGQHGQAAAGGTRKDAAAARLGHRKAAAFVLGKAHQGITAGGRALVRLYAQRVQNAQYAQCSLGSVRFGLVVAPVAIGMLASEQFLHKQAAGRWLLWSLAPRGHRPAGRGDESVSSSEPTDFPFPAARGLDRHEAHGYG